MYGAYHRPNRATSPWQAIVKRDGRQVSLGYHETEIQASQAAREFVDANRRAREDVYAYPDRSVPVDPTRAEPGTPEKLAVLRERAAKRAPLFHAHDRVEPHHWRGIVAHVQHLTPETV